MKIQQKDIWVRRERNARQVVWISEAYLIESLKFLTEHKIRTKHRYTFIKTVKGDKRRKQNILPDTGASWRYARKNGTFYYDYDRLPDGRRLQLPNKRELIELHKEALASNIQSELEQELLSATTDLTTYLPAYKTCTDAQANHLALACAVIEYAAKEVASKPPTSSNDFYRNLGEVIKRRAWCYLPKNYRRLKDKIMMAVDGANIHTIIKLPRKGNNNKQAFSNKQVIGWMMHLRSRPENYSNAFIARLILKMCAISNLNAPSKSWIEHYFSRQNSKFLTGAKRHKSSRRGADYNDYIPVQGALYAGDCWQMDGSRINIIPHKSADGKERSMMGIIIRDVHSGDIVGYHLDTKEDRYGYLHALNMAVVNTGHLPYELVHDRFPGHNTDEWTLISERMKREGVKITITSTGTGKAHVERCFSTLQDVFMQGLEYYYGQGVQSRNEAAHRSPDYLYKVKKQAKREGFDFDKAWHIGSSIINEYRNTKLSEYSTAKADIEMSPKELYEASQTPNVIAVDDFLRLELFGTYRSVTIRNNGLIRMRIHKADYTYRITDYDVISNYKKVSLYYDLEDLSKVHLFAPGDDINTHYLCQAVEETAIQYYGPDADMKKLAKAKQARKAVRIQRDEELAEAVGEVSNEIDLLMTKALNKNDTDNAQDQWLEDRVNIWQDKGTESRVFIPELVEVEEDINEEELIKQAMRNY